MVFLNAKLGVQEHIHFLDGNPRLTLIVVLFTPEPIHLPPYNPKRDRDISSQQAVGTRPASLPGIRARFVFFRRPVRSLPLVLEVFQHELGEAQLLDFAFAPFPVTSVAVLDRSLRVVASGAVALRVPGVAEVPAYVMSGTGFAGCGDDLACQLLAIVAPYSQADTHGARREMFWMIGFAKPVGFSVLFELDMGAWCILLAVGIRIV